MLAINIYMWFYLITNDEWDGKFLEYRTFFQYYEAKEKCGGNEYYVLS